MSGAYICCGALKQLARTVVVALLSANLTSLGMMAKEKQGFGFHFVEDFSKYHPRKGLTPQKQESMAERRRGVYASEPGVLAGRIREQLGKDVRHLILDISTDNRVKLIFECTDGECVSTTYFMEGRMSDTSFLWGTLGEGVVARYGVLGDYLPVAFCPRRRPVTLVMKRRGEKMDSKSVRLVSTEISLAECREQDDDLFGLICENAIMARTIRTKVENGKCLLNDSEVVAYYVKTGSSIRYWVLQANGGFRKFEVTLESAWTIRRKIEE